MKKMTVEELNKLKAKEGDESIFYVNFKHISN
jgi:hypothetical protein